MGLPTVSSSLLSPAPSEREGVIVVMDANRNRGNVDALEWALNNVVRPKDAVVVLGVLYDIGKKNFSCFPLNMGISISGIWERLEFSSSGHGEVNPRELGEEIERKRGQYQITLQPFYRQCKRNEVKLEVKLAAGYCPAKVTVEEAQNSNTRWIVLDSHLKKHRDLIYGHVRCNVAVMKGKDFATLMPSKAPMTKHALHQNLETTEIIINGISSNNETRNLQSRNPNYYSLEVNPAPTPPSPCWFPLSWRTGYPRAFTLNELEEITNEFSDEFLIQDKDDIKVYQGNFQGIPVIINSYPENDERFWSMLTILSRVRHRNIMNLVGYCCSGASRILLADFPSMATLDINLKDNDSARNLSWKARWYIAQEIGRSLRYLHEECGEEIVHQSVCSSNVVISHCCSAMLSNFITAKSLSEESPVERYENSEKDELLYVDVHDYGMFLVELITGKNAGSFTNHHEVQSLLDWALPILEDGPITQMMDPRLMNNSDTWVVHQMAKAALICLKIDNSGHRYSISEVLAVVRGDQLAISRC